MPRVVITGATGMIGSALSRVCLDAGYEVLALARKDSPRLSNLPHDGHLQVFDSSVDRYGSIGPEQVGEADVFFHLAWVGTSPSARGALNAQVDNISYTLDAVELAHRLGCSVFVGAGSQAEYGHVQGDLCPDTPAFPTTGYGVAKLAAGQMSRLACQSLGMRHEWARILSIYGPGDNLHTMVMQVIADACAGNSPRCTKGEQLWDYLYCDDCARALLSIAESGSDGRTYPIGSGTQRRLADFIGDICDLCDTGVSPDFGAIPYQDEQVMYLRANTDALCGDTGFKPQVSFEEGISRTIEWYREDVR